MDYSKNQGCIQKFFRGGGGGGKFGERTKEGGGGGGGRSLCEVLHLTLARGGENDKYPSPLPLKYSPEISSTSESSKLSDSQGPLSIFCH